MENEKINTHLGLLCEGCHKDCVLCLVRIFQNIITITNLRKDEVHPTDTNEGGVIVRTEEI